EHRELLMIAIHRLPSPLVVGLELTELYEAQRRTHLINTVIKPGGHDVVLKLWPRSRSQVRLVIPCERSSLIRSASSSWFVVSIPPPQWEKFLLEKKQNHPIFPMLPHFLKPRSPPPSDPCPGNVIQQPAPGACATSSTTYSPWRCASAMILSISQG